MDNSSRKPFEVHNYAHVDRAFHEAANRTAVYTKYVARQGLISTAIGLGILLVGVGLFIVFLSWGYSFLNKPAVPIYVEKPIYVPLTQEQTLSVAKENAVSKISDLQQKDVGEKGLRKNSLQPVYNYTIFKTIPFHGGSVKEITIGMRYGTQNDPTPSRQWCYVERHNSTGIVNMVYLAEKNGTKFAEQKLSSSMAAELGLTRSQLADAQALCSFE